MRTAVILVVVGLSAVQANPPPSDRDKRADEEAPAVAVEAETEEDPEGTQRTLCRRTLGNVCKVAGGICVGGGSCGGGRRPRLIKFPNCQSCSCCPSGGGGTSCPWTKACQDKGGKCSDQCGWGTRALGGLCSYGHCSCCVPECVTTNLCFAANGKCVEAGMCFGGTIKPGLCAGGWNCHCCVPKEPQPRCSRTPRRCSRQGGSCQETCAAGYVELKDGCNEEGCKCCVPEGCKPLDGCNKKGGTCREKKCEKGEEAAEKGCQGVDCVCCVPEPDRSPCSPTKECKNVHGVCKEWCENKEEELPYGCEGHPDKCKCCYVPY